ncbi:acetylxylan esterase [Singulisphaera sp. PoT]|uniref:acetylxylan esterase n=1 Tax=Singulisphaera sp. PoT TaxID=3411797 RepID=UPI003BF5D483
MTLKKSPLALGAGLLVFVLFVNLSRAGVPKVIEAGNCQAAPTIDGIIHDDEWAAAGKLEFDMSLIRLEPPGNESRRAELRAMNSANALYIALKVPDATIDKSVSPLMLDAAILAFAKGDKVLAGDDRKLIAQGFYRDKFIVAPGKDDGDDPKQDGLGAMSRNNGICSFEWALRLDAGDSNDLRAKPGDAIRFNVGYFDGFQVPITKTRMGGLYGPRLDQPGEWGTLRLASNVKDDGGVAFQSPPWVKALGRELQNLFPKRLKVTGDAISTAASPAPGKVLATLNYLDPNGKEKESKVKLFFPESLRTDKSRKLPLLFIAGYELPEGAEQDYINRGWIVASARELETNPLIRTMNPDVAFLHIARAMPWVDDSRVMIAGGSAGGWMTLLLAAETFPLAGAAPDVPPVNWGYNGAYAFKQLAMAGPHGEAPAKVPALFAVASMLTPSLSVYGGDYDDPTWFADSPVAQVSTITCPVSVYWSTADVLVPIDQIGKSWVRPFDPSQFPPEFTMDPSKLMKSQDGRLTLLEALHKEDYELFKLPVPEGTLVRNVPGSTGTAKVAELPLSQSKPWSITIIDEGAPTPSVDHRKYELLLTRNDFYKRVSTGAIARGQLTPAKLGRLMDRYAGKEFLPSRLKHLDRPEVEKADVIRGLRTYVAASPENREHFAKLYAELPQPRQVLERETLQSLK